MTYLLDIGSVIHKSVEKEENLSKLVKKFRNVSLK